MYRFNTLLITFIALALLSCKSEGNTMLKLRLGSSDINRGMIYDSEYGINSKTSASELSLHPVGAPIELFAVVNESRVDSVQFKGWRGTFTSSENPLKFTLEDDVTLVADFGAAEYEFRQQIFGDGEVELVEYSITRNSNGGTVEYPELIPYGTYLAVGIKVQEGSVITSASIQIGNEIIDMGINGPIYEGHYWSNGAMVDGELMVTINVEKIWRKKENGIIQCKYARTSDKGLLDGIEYSAITDTDIAAMRESINTTDRYSLFENKCSSQLTDMFNIFGAMESIPDITHWDVSNVTDMEYLFYGSVNFNQPIGNWEVNNVNNMNYMFGEASAFNQDISNWDVSNVSNRIAGKNQACNGYAGDCGMVGMFYDASAFSQDLSKWCVTKIKSAPKAFATGSSLTDEQLPKWGTCPAN